MNKLFQQLQPKMQTQQQLPMRSQPNLKSLLSKSNVNSFKTLLNSSNPQELIQNLISQNPKIKNVMQLMQNSGQSPKEFFYNFAQQQGINPDEFINSLMQE